MKTPSVGLIYSGAGAGGVAGKQNGFDVSYIIEPRPGFVEKTWRYNFPSAKISSNLKAFRDTQVDVIIGSPPCSKYSLLNRTKTRQDLYATDPTKVEYTAFLREIQKRRPEFFILENLPRIRQFLFFPYNHEPTFIVHYYDASTGRMETRPVLTIPGYRVYQYVLNTVHYGLAQHRKRLFIVGVKEPHSWVWTPPPDSEVNWLNQAIRDIKEGSANHKIEPLSEKDLYYWRKLKFNQKSSANRKVRKMAPKSPCRTIVSASLRYYHYKEPRFLTPRECARLQGFPDDFIFFGSVRQQLNQVGKSIAPPVVSTFLREIRSSLDMDFYHKIVTDLYAKGLSKIRNQSVSDS